MKPKESAEMPYDFVRGYRYAIFNLRDWLNTTDDFDAEALRHYMERNLPDFTTEQLSGQL